MLQKRAKSLKIQRLNHDSAELIFERDINHENYTTEVEYSYLGNKETFRISLTLEELYLLTRDILRAASEKVQINRPGEI